MNKYFGNEDWFDGREIEFPWENVYGGIREDLPLNKELSLTDHEQTYRARAVDEVLQNWEGEVPPDMVADVCKTLAWIDSL